jgi:alkanesulfonate monooxygenase SsuD/methylene tetrahydromethanopterin reductase-like flavin-dependent oxidoreductase (luciferase family)
MRIGINLPLKSPDGVPLDAAGIAGRARMVEEAGLDGIWIQDSMIPGFMRPDPLMWLLVASAATTELEVGTSILIVPLRNPVDLAQRFLTLEALTHGRFTFGVGAGSTRASHESAGVAFDDRFKLLYGHMDAIRRLCQGEPVGAANLDPWPSVRGRPRFVLGAWHSELSLRRAVAEYDGWMCSAGRTNYTIMAQGIERYRQLGGGRALVSTCPVDLSAPTEPLRDDDQFHLRCGPDEAARRLQRLADLGFDDVLLVMADHTGRTPLFDVDHDLETLRHIRSLLPPDGRKAWHAESRPPAAEGTSLPRARGAAVPDRQVTRTRKERGRVVALGGDWGERTSPVAVIDIQNAQHTYHVMVDGERRDVVVVRGEDRRHLRTNSDLSGPDVLEALPDL